MLELILIVVLGLFCAAGAVLAILWLAAWMIS